MATRVHNEPGMAAQFDTVCDRCDGLIRKGARIVLRRGSYIHAGCASGQEDE